jgi:hypothetical protein
LPTHISFSYDPSDNEDEEQDILNENKDDFQYVPISSQSKLVQFQFLTFARQQQLELNSNDDNNEKNNDDEDDDEEEEDTLIDQNMEEDDEEDQEEQQEVRYKID